MEQQMMLLTSSQILIDMASAIFASHGFEIPALRSEADQVVQRARQAVRQGVKVLVSRGYTSTLLRANLNVPVIEIRMTCYDFISAVNRARDISDRVAIVGYKNIWEVYLEQYRVILGDPNIVYIQKPEELPGTMLRLKREGVEVVVGGGPACACARQNGMAAVHIGAENGAIEDALIQARHLLRIEQDRVEKYELINSLLNSVYESVVAVDLQGKIANCNTSARELLGENCAGEELARFLSKPELLEVVQRGDTISEELVKVNGALCTLSGRPVMVGGQGRGAAFTLQPVLQVQRMERTIHKKMTHGGNKAKYTFSDIIGTSPAIHATKERARQYAKSNSTILICGETGTGKELFAQSIHNQSRRSDKPFVAINCAALPQDILESELFGYVKGAFTGARSEGRAGVFESANQGTILLDEIGEISIEMQLKLLRVLQEREIRRIGDDKVLPIDVRVIAATNKDLYQEMVEGRFRKDLYYRLAVLELELPPLRSRKEDIGDIATYLLHQVAEWAGLPPPTLTEEARQMLMEADWPGNVRQLRNVIERLISLECGEEIGRAEIEAVLKNHYPQPVNEIRQAVGAPPKISQREKQRILNALWAEGGNRTRAAELLEMSKTTLWRKIKEIQKTDPDFLRSRPE